MKLEKAYKHITDYILIKFGLTRDKHKTLFYKVDVFLTKVIEQEIQTAVEKKRERIRLEVATYSQISSQATHDLIKLINEDTKHVV